jgi:tetratricopeptide (TPR) repeat protein
MYNLAREFAEQSQYALVKAGALNGLAMIYRDRLDFREAINNHLAAQRLLERIEARGDLAEVYYQLGLTYLKMNELAEGRTLLQQALNLFRQMDAPKQVEKVQQVLEDVKNLTLP